jgi:UDP-N-acetylmuramate--alanine ligase
MNKTPEKTNSCDTWLERPGTVWHLIGIGGIGVSAVARLLLGAGRSVQGSDVRTSQLTEALVEEGARVTIGHHANNLEGADVVVVSTAIPDTNIELITARAQGITVVHRSQLLGALIHRAPTAIGVTGTHGKGTVSATIQCLLNAGGLEPGFVIGGLLLDEGTNARTGAGQILVAEVDESDGSHRNVRPTHAVLNNLELDHLNYYDSWEKLESFMISFAADNPRLETFHANQDDEGVQGILPKLQSLGVSVRTFGIEQPSADLWAKDLRPRRLENGHLGGSMTVIQKIDGRDQELGTVEIQLPGRYNLSNVLGGLSVALELGVDFPTAQRALGSFQGLENRFTVVESGDKLVVKDYISHPTGIRRVLEGASLFDQGPIVAVFKPYRFTMIHYLQDDYRDAFVGADHVIITELYTAGEVPIPGIDTEFLCNKIRESGAKVSFVKEMNDIGSHLLRHHPEPGMVLFFGGDDLFGVADRYTRSLAGDQC